MYVFADLSQNRYNLKSRRQKQWKYIQTFKLTYSKIKFHTIKDVKIGRYVICMCCFCVSDIINLKNTIIRTAMECRLNNSAWDYLDWDRCVSFLMHISISILPLAWIIGWEEILEKEF